MAIISRDDSVWDRVGHSFIPACFEWNITKNTTVYNKQLLDLLGLPASETLSIEDFINLKFIIDKDAVISEVYKILEHVERLKSK